MTTEDKVSTPVLHLGKFLEGQKDEKQNRLLLKFDDLCHHGAVLAGSGAGKSTTVGRIVEEILIKTRGRVVIIDTNGDFRKSHEVLEKEHKIWSEANQKIDDRLWDRDDFAKSWNEVTRIQFTRTANSLDQPEGVFPPRIRWSDLPIAWQMDILRMDIGRHHEEITELHRAGERIVNDLASPKRLIEELRHSARFPSSTEASKKAASTLAARLTQADTLCIWQKNKEDLDLRSSFEKEIKDRHRLSIFDVPSIVEVEPRNILLSYLLKILWEIALLDWEKASEKVSEDPDKEDPRTPTFIVIDEAHNFVPAEDPTDPHALRISQSIQRIAAEGRKYGLFLLLATQRPSKVRPGLLSECENVCLLRLRSPIERGLAVDTWALRDDNRHPRLSPLAKYNKGEGLLFGHWTGWHEIPFKTGMRRTRPTGGDLPKTWIPSVIVKSE